MDGIIHSRLKMCFVVHASLNHMRHILQALLVLVWHTLLGGARQTQATNVHNPGVTFPT